MNRDDATLLDIEKAARQIQLFVQEMSQTQFLNDDKSRSAVLYQLLVMGEAVKRLSGAFRNQHSTIPWSLIAGMRDHLIHAYDTVDWEEVWKTAVSDVPELLANIDPLLPEQPDS